MQRVQKSSNAASLNQAHDEVKRQNAFTKFPMKYLSHWRGFLSLNKNVVWN